MTRRVHPRIRVEFAFDELEYRRVVDYAMLPQKGRFYAVSWTWRNFRLYRTKAAAERAMKNWKRWHERRGNDVDGSIARGYVAFAPGYERGNPRPGENVWACSVHTYDAEKHERVMDW